MLQGTVSQLATELRREEPADVCRTWCHCIPSSLQWSAQTQHREEARASSLSCVTLLRDIFSCRVSAWKYNRSARKTNKKLRPAMTAIYLQSSRTSTSRCDDVLLGLRTSEWCGSKTLANSIAQGLGDLIIHIVFAMVQWWTDEMFKPILYSEPTTVSRWSHLGQRNIIIIMRDYYLFVLEEIHVLWYCTHTSEILSQTGDECNHLRNFMAMG